MTNDKYDKAPKWASTEPEWTPICNVQNPAEFDERMRRIYWLFEELRRQVEALRNIGNREKPERKTWLGFDSRPPKFPRRDLKRPDSDYW